MTIDELLNNYRKTSATEIEKGKKFEVLMKNFLPLNYRGEIEKVMLWQEFSNEKDLGIDLVAKTYGGEFWAIQCKFYAENTVIEKSAVDSFISNSGRTFNGKKFSLRIFISTSDNFTDNAAKMFEDQTPPVIQIGMEDLRNAAVDWEKLDAGEFVRLQRNLREYQIEALDAAHEHFKNHERGKLIMACGTGKTFTALRIAEDLTQNCGLVLFLVPSLSLVKQTLNEWTNFSADAIRAICVCSDKTVAADDDIKNVMLKIPVTNQPEEITAAVNRKGNFGMTVIFSTYQSIEKVIAANLNFDLVICDEAHRTTGYGKDATPFTAVHSNEFIKAKKRMYMTATPRLYTSKALKKSVDKDLMLWSMDDPEIYGEEFYYIGFGDAIKENLLSDYKVIVLAVGKQNIPPAVQNALSKDGKIDFADTAKIVGCLNAISKKSISNSELVVTSDPSPMKKAVLFCTTKKLAENIKESFDKLQADGFKISAKYVDGTMSSNVRNEKLKWLKDTSADSETCRILTNARCLSEGVDVPTLDAVIFFSPKKSQIDIVQAVGRVMRKPKSTDKKYGYVIIPVVIPIDKNPEDVLPESEDYGTIWDILNAMRAHDTRIDILVEDIKMNKKPSGGRGGGGGDGGEPPEIILDGFSDEWQKIIYARMVENVGNRRYWEQWAQDISKIAENHKQKILQLTNSKEFRNFILDLRENINPTITEKDAVEMLAQHLISRPVFDALFENYSFAQNNAVSKSMQQILNILDTETDNAQLEKFYKSVKERCSIAKTSEDKQKIIIELYDKFFKIALPKEVEKLGIVYTPVEVVDFILNSVNDVLKKEFNRTISSKNVHILDPFTGTGTFIVRLIQSGLIQPKDLLRKYQNELHANEIVLLAYYIAAINIENAFHDAFLRTKDEGLRTKDFTPNPYSLSLSPYIPFNGICFTDTFQTYENQQEEIEEKRQGAVGADFKKPLQENFALIKKQLDTKIEIIVGNPPYSVGQKSANDNAQNTWYKNIEDRIKNTYAAGTAATNKNSLYDSYIKAFRWASDRIGDSGIIAFITNSGWLDKDAFTGFRKCLQEEFSSVYVFNLKGDIRGKMGENARRAGQNIFNIMTGVAITILVKNSSVENKSAEIFYYEVVDYLNRDEKISQIKKLNSVLSEDFKIIEPNEKGDWINQRGNTFETFLPLAPDKKFDAAAQSFFVIDSRGLQTARDAWCCNFSKSKLVKNIQTTIDFYNSNSPENVDSTKISWTRATIQNKNRHIEYKFDEDKIFKMMYRPFCELNFYYDKYLNEYLFQTPKFFPIGNEENFLICLTGSGGRKGFAVMIVDKIAEYHFTDDTQCFPLYWYEAATEQNLFGESLTRRDGVTDFIWRQARLMYGDAVTKEDIFYYVYGFLHLPAYREKFAADLKKSLPRIFLVPEPRKFWQLSKAGRELAQIHLYYEEQPAANVEVVQTGENYHVEKLRLSADKKTLIYNADITIKNIPARAFEYVVNGRSPLEWIIDRYQVKTDKASCITNDPNDWCREHNNPRYILDLILSCITVSLKTLDIVENLPSVDF